MADWGGLGGAFGGSGSSSSWDLTEEERKRKERLLQRAAELAAQMPMLSSTTDTGGVGLMSVGESRPAQRLAAGVDTSGADALVTMFDGGSRDSKPSVSGRQGVVLEQDIRPEDRLKGRTDLKWAKKRNDVFEPNDERRQIEEDARRIVSEALDPEILDAVLPPAFRSSGYDDPTRATPSTRKASGPDPSKMSAEGPERPGTLGFSLFSKKSFPGLGEGLTIIEDYAGDAEDALSKLKGDGSWGFDPKDTNRDGRVGWMERKPNGFLRKLARAEKASRPWRDDPNTPLDERKAFFSGLGRAAAAMGPATGPNAGANLGQAFGLASAGRDEALQQQFENYEQSRKTDSDLLSAIANRGRTLAETGQIEESTRGTAIQNRAAQLQTDWARADRETQLAIEAQAKEMALAMNPELGQLADVPMPGKFWLTILQGESQQYQRATEAERLRAEGQEGYNRALMAQAAARGEQSVTEDERFAMSYANWARANGMNPAETVSFIETLQGPYSEEQKRQALEEMRRRMGIAMGGGDQE